VSLLGSWRAYRRFQTRAPEWRELVFFAESRQDWHHFAPILERLTADHGRRVCYLTSDPDDFAFSRRSALLEPFYVPEGWAQIVAFQTLRADVMVLTMMDLGNFQLKRSFRPVHYVYVFHSLGSTHMVDFASSYDHYDTVLCAGPHQMREIRRREELAGLPPKRLLPHGYARLEVLWAEAQRRPRVRAPGQEPTLLVAPTWGEQSLLAVCGERLTELLLEAGFRVIVRPHYQMLRESPDCVVRLRARFEGHPRFEYVDWMGDTDTLHRSDLLISDWSAIAVEYALGLERPVLFVDVPPRVRNPEYGRLGLEPLEIAIRPRVGAVLPLDQLEDAPGFVAKLLADPEARRQRIAALRGELLFNPGSSAQVAAREIARIADERASARHGA
jgi:YidC/Oxa1 family membrane protein insertase